MLVTVKNESQQTLTVFEVGTFTPGEHSIDLTPEQIDIIKLNAQLKVVIPRKTTKKADKVAKINVKAELDKGSLRKIKEKDEDKSSEDEDKSSKETAQEKSKN